MSNVPGNIKYLSVRLGKGEEVFVREERVPYLLDEELVGNPE